MLDYVMHILALDSIYDVCTIGRHSKEINKKKTFFIFYWVCMCVVKLIVVVAIQLKINSKKIVPYTFIHFYQVQS